MKKANGLFIVPQYSQFPSIYFHQHSSATFQLLPLFPVAFLHQTLSLQQTNIHQHSFFHLV